MTLELHNLKPSFRRKPRKRVGRGNSAGGGTYAGRGIKGQHSRSGGNTRPGFEGGRSTIIVQTPKMRGKGFKSLKPKAIAVPVEKLNGLPENADIVTLKTLLAANFVSYGPVKIVGDGDLKRKLKVKLPVSASARAKIEKAGGEVILPQEPKEEKKEEKSKK